MDIVIVLSFILLAIMIPTVASKKVSVVIKAIVVAITLMPLVFVLGLFEEYSHIPIFIFLSTLIIVSTGVVVSKINKLSERLDSLAENKCSCQKELNDNEEQP